ncbi:MAG: site-specific integrase [Candidatus Paralactobacillus gallistercoris]|uniref:Site-specific integrase n=1 Tax=Candidatus Paralactobacillus gallistercoris TaxID=2838724 RepID=A0A948X0Y7_9LACO|nr:site-specific integrase [Candidatus Paralactobacillus gallistercoris]
MQQIVLPIKDDQTLHRVQQTLLSWFRAGRRNYTIFQVGKATMLRVSDVLALHYHDVFTTDDQVRFHAYIHDRKTGKPNTLYLKPVVSELLTYQQWLHDRHIISPWLFPSMRHYDRHITEKQYYKVMAKVGELLHLEYLGTHTMRKTGAYRVYTQTNYNIGLVMKLLNHSSEAMTLAYLGLDQEAREHTLDQIDFG